MDTLDTNILPSSFDTSLSDTASTNQLLDIPDTSFHNNPKTVHLRPTKGDSSLQNDLDIPPVNGIKQTPDSGLSADVGARADVFAGVIIFSVGMVVLIGAMIFYFVNGRSWRTIKGRSNELLETDQLDDSKEENNLPSCSQDEESQIQTSNNNFNTEISPSTARLIDPPAKSVFGFLKGTQRPLYATEGNVDPLDSAMIMPALTRTKARSSIKRKSGPNVLPANIESSKDHFTINIQDQGSLLNPASAADLAAPSPIFARTTRKKHTPETTIATKTITRSGRSTTPTLLRTEIPPQANPSTIGLYGSAKSSPNGSLADAASVQAIYSRSIRSTMSYNTYTESSLALECPEQEVVLATSEIGH